MEGLGNTAKCTVNQETQSAKLRVVHGHSILDCSSEPTGTRTALGAVRRWCVVEVYCVLRLGGACDAEIAGYAMMLMPLFLKLLLWDGKFEAIKLTVGLSWLSFVSLSSNVYTSELWPEDFCFGLGFPTRTRRKDAKQPTWGTSLSCM